MSTIKNYGLIGVGPDVQFGKAGGRIVYNTGASDFRITTDGTTLGHLQVLDPVGATDAATKAYVDSVATGLDAKESSRAATTGNLAGATYSAGGGAGGTGQFTNAPTTLDGVTLAQGNRVLVKDQSTATQNGIYVVTATTSTWDRASDFDENSEVTAGAYTFVTEGTTNINTGWVLAGPDPLTLNSSNLNWNLFSASGSLIAGVGLIKNGNALDLDFSELSSVNVDVLTGADELIVQDNTTESRITITNFLNTFNVPNNITANGLIVRTAADTYTSRTLSASAVASEEGIVVTNGNGVSGNPTVGLDIDGTTASGSAASDTDTLLIFDGTNNRKYTVSQLAGAPAFGGGTTSIADGDSSVAVSDVGAGTVTTTIDSTSVITSVLASTTFNHDLIVSTGDTLTVVDLSANRVVYTTTGGELTSSANLTFNGSILDVTGQLDVDDVRINGNTISVTATNANLDLQANGTGDIRLLDGAGNEIAEFLNGATAVNHLSFQAGATGIAPTISSNSVGSETNVDIGFVLKGTGVLSVTAGTGNYEDNVTADDDVPNKKYVDDAIATSTAAGTVGSITATINFTSASTQAIGTIPANATVLRVTLNVGTASDAATQVDIGDATNGTASYMDDTENDPQTLGTYVASTFVQNGGSNVTANAIVTTAGSTGSGTVIVEYRNA